MSLHNTTTECNFKVIVIGAGIAGLAAAHHLERAKRQGNAPKGLQVVVYEQREGNPITDKYPAQLSEDARQCLTNIIAPASYSDLVDLSDYGISHGGVNILNNDLTHLFSNKKYENEQPQWINRKVLSSLLSDGVNVLRGRRVVRVRDLKDNKVEVVLDNGTTELADFVIGADGMNSTIRSQLHPAFSKTPQLPFILVQFKLATPFPQIPKAFQRDCVNLVLGNSSNSTQIILFSGSQLPLMDPKTAIKLSEEGPFAEPNDEVKAVQQALEDPKCGFVLVRMMIPTRLTQDWEDLTDGSWIDKILTFLREDGTNLELIKMIENDLVPATIQASPIFSSEIGKAVPFKEGRIVLIGDAMHVVPPTNIAAALKDAQDIAETLLASSELGGADGPLQTLLPQNHYALKTRSEDYLKKSLHLLEVSNQTGIQGFLHRGMLRSMNWLKSF
uniref:FAD dependent oxidoreductase domain-containing protein n=1 Tax=Kwoniella pini CBS 10737 TaxID=1296096 RepID=A0A1B9I1K1_9TREE|nr:uncharacterized protein I206_05100 [Kwoniella pini CBS 10737]OCF49407.1 hypothetical protein I206_05100 [Kwoniella pini CBS 10737]